MKTNEEIRAFEVSVGNIIKELRKEKKMTQEEFSKAIGVSRTALAKYETGATKNLKRETLKRIAEYCEVSPAYFFGGEREPNTTKPELIKIIDQLTKEQQNALLAVAKTMVK